VSAPAKKVLIVTYYWPPAGGPGVQRVLKFAKYLPEFGWQPLILTVKNGEYPAFDPTLEKEVPEAARVFRTAAIEPNFLYKKFTGMSSDESIPVAVLADKKLNWKKRLANSIRLNLFVPDAKIGWIPFAVKRGHRILEEEKPDVIFSSSPPPSVHLIARKLAKSGGLKWVADFRDPWTDIHYYEDYRRIGLARRIDHNLEYNVLRRADVVTCISRLDIELDFAQKIEGQRFVNIANGYDETDFTGIHSDGTPSDKFVLMHLGGVGSERNPINLFKAVRALLDQGRISPPDFELVFIGKVDEVILQTVEELGLAAVFTRIPYLPHREALQRTQTASAMLLLVTQSQKNLRILPGKTFEYMRTGKPILALGPEDGEVARILNDSNTGKMISYEKYDEIYDNVLRLYSQWRKAGSLQQNVDADIQSYSRQNLTAKLVNVFESIL